MKCSTKGPMMMTLITGSNKVMANGRIRSRGAKWLARDWSRPLRTRIEIVTAAAMTTTLTTGLEDCCIDQEYRGPLDVEAFVGRATRGVEGEVCHILVTRDVASISALTNNQQRS